MAELDEILNLTPQLNMAIPPDYTPSGWVYVLANESMPGVYKIGMTQTSPEKRAKEISSATGVPSPFIVVSSFRSDSPFEHEKKIHQLLSRHRISQGREFFKTTLDVIDDICQQVIPYGEVSQVEELTDIFNLICLDVAKTMEPKDCLEAYGIAAFGSKTEAVDVLSYLGALVVKKLTQHGGAVVVHGNAIRLIGLDEDIPV